MSKRDYNRDFGYSVKVGPYKDFIQNTVLP